MTDCIVGFRVPYIKGPDTEPLEKKVQHLEQFAENIIAKVERVSDSLTQPFTDAVAEAEELIRNAEFITHRAGPRRGVRLPGRPDPGVAADGVRPRPRAAGADQLDAPVRPAGPGQPRRAVLVGVPRRRRGVRPPRPPRHHRRPVLPGDGREPTPPARRPESLAAFDDRELDVAPDGTLRVAVRAAAGRQEPDHPRGLQRLGDRGARPALDRAHRHRRRTGHPAGPRPAGEEVRDRRQAAGRLDPDLVRVPALLPVPGAGQHADRRRGRRRAAWSRSAPRSATTSWPTTRRWW